MFIVLLVMTFETRKIKKFDSWSIFFFNDDKFLSLEMTTHESELYQKLSHFIAKGFRIRFAASSELTVATEQKSIKY